MTTASVSEPRFDRLVGFLAEDPDNLALLADAADAALAESRYAEASDIIDRHGRIAPPPPSLINGLGLCALAEGRHADAVCIFESLHAQSPSDSGLLANLAWARSGLDDHLGVLDAVDGAKETVAIAMLKVRALHNLGRLEEAMAVGDAWTDRDGSPELWGVLASVALDAEAVDRAETWAQRASDTPDGATALGIIALSGARAAEAREFFEHALSARPDFARGLTGLGAVLLDEGKPIEAAKNFDKAAKIFDTHLGTWVAAGWAYLIAGDLGNARSRFERVLAIDETFSEGHGGLAVLDVLEGHDTLAERRAEIALRLDRRGLGGALARSMLLEQSGDVHSARRLRTMALEAPAGADGKTIAQMIALAASRST